MYRQSLHQLTGIHVRCKNELVLSVKTKSEFFSIHINLFLKNADNYIKPGGINCFKQRSNHYEFDHNLILNLLSFQNTLLLLYSLFSMINTITKINQ